MGIAPLESDPRTVLQTYEQRVGETARERDAVARRSRMISHGRFALFVVFIAVLAWIEAVGTQGTAKIALAALLGVAFLVLVGVHGRIRRRLEWLEAMHTVNEDAQRRVRRDWDALPIDEHFVAPEDHPYAQDLDLFGTASVFQLLGSVKSAPGKTTLAAWLLEPAPQDEIERRQESVAELAPRLDFRQRFEVAARLTRNPDPVGVERFLDWAESGSWLQRHPWLLWAGRALGVATLALLVLHLTGVISYAFWLVPILVNFAITARIRTPIHRAFKRASANESSFRAYAAMLHLLEGDDLRAPMLQEAQRAVAHGEVLAHRELRRLHNLSALADIRLSMLYPVLQGLVLWDVHVLHSMEKWKSRSGGEARRWLQTLGEFEVLASLAGLAHDNPDWILPSFDQDGAPKIVARALGHPLLPGDVRVSNDVSIGPPGSFLLVTGSNMSGKSTMLRAIGVNMVLAQAGGPVCAQRFTAPVVRLFTSMRISDSLRDGVSYFMAGLRRLKQIVDAARLDDAERPLCYLLDEILQGTNTAERMVAVRGVIAELLDRPAVGVVTTHDLGLAEAPELVNSLDPVHFSESIGEGGGVGAMTFDYVLRPGVATSRNALRLMELMGLRDGGR